MFTKCSLLKQLSHRLPLGSFSPTLQLLFFFLLILVEGRDACQLLLLLSSPLSPPPLSVLLLLFHQIIKLSFGSKATGSEQWKKAREGEGQKKCAKGALVPRVAASDLHCSIAGVLAVVMDRHTCKLCFRRFQNGRALGGHMRSHVMAAAAAAAASAAYSPPPPQQQQSPPLSFASTSSTDIDCKPAPQKPLSCFWREDSKKSGKVGAPEFSSGCFGGVAAAGESSVVQDGESDTESPRGGGGFAVGRRRSKRARRRAPPSAPDPEPASSVSDATQEEDVAMSLVMLSRDSWTRSRSEPEHHWARASSEAEQNNDNVNVFDEDEDVRDVAGEDYEAWYGEPTAAHPRTRHQCGICKKLFRSYQALGGHRARVKKGKGGCVPPPLPAPAKASYRVDAPVIHECPFCFRVFGSGQALGGHKRAHMPSGGALAPPPPLPSPAKCGDSFGSFDLNVPAALDDDFELSAVYDAEYGSSRH